MTTDGTYLCVNNRRKIFKNQRFVVVIAVSPGGEKEGGRYSQRVISSGAGASWR